MVVNIPKKIMRSTVGKVLPFRIHLEGSEFY